jgi:hypothetical protein
MKEILNHVVRILAAQLESFHRTPIRTESNPAAKVARPPARYPAGHEHQQQH